MRARGASAATAAAVTLAAGSAAILGLGALRAASAGPAAAPPPGASSGSATTAESDPPPLDAGIMTGDAQAAAARDPALAGHFVFIWPLPDTDVNSGLGWRSDPVVGRHHEHAGYHMGLDLAAAKGTLIRATGPGRVVRAGWWDGFGLCVEIDHPDGFRSLYGHMSAVLVVAGMRVRRGAAIGLVGATGHATGPHLHFTLYHGGVIVDPTDYIGHRSDEPDPY